MPADKPSSYSYDQQAGFVSKGLVLLGRLLEAESNVIVGTLMDVDGIVVWRAMPAGGLPGGGCEYWFPNGVGISSVRHGVYASHYTNAVGDS